MPSVGENQGDLRISLCYESEAKGEVHMDREQLLKKIEEITRSGDDNDTLLTR